MPPKNFAAAKTTLMATPSNVTRSAAFSFLKKYFLVIGVEWRTKLCWKVLIFAIHFFVVSFTLSPNINVEAKAKNIPTSIRLMLFRNIAGINVKVAAIYVVDRTVIGGEMMWK